METKEKARSWEELQKEISDEAEWQRKHPILSFIIDKWNFTIHRLPRIIFKEFPHDIQDFFERGKKGYAVRDAWSTHYYLATITAKMVAQIRDNHDGVPGELCNTKDVNEASKDWTAILDNIVYTFDTIVRELDDEVVILNSRTYNKEKEKIEAIGIYGDRHILTKEECKKYEKGWTLFRKYFTDLWD